MLPKNHFRKIRLRRLHLFPDAVGYSLSYKSCNHLYLTMHRTISMRRIFTRCWMDPVMCTRDCRTILMKRLPTILSWSKYHTYNIRYSSAYSSTQFAALHVTFKSPLHKLVQHFHLSEQLALSLGPQCPVLAVFSPKMLWLLYFLLQTLSCAWIDRIMVSIVELSV